MSPVDGIIGVFPAFAVFTAVYAIGASASLERVVSCAVDSPSGEFARIASDHPIFRVS